jgi:UDP-4-amino-4,6-dideoxy-N-acetyl-beta-L-altrosamine transaminase
LFCGAKYAVAVNSGTAALHCAYFAAGITAGDEVITSPNSFAATANAALYLGASPVFCDIRPDTYNIDEKKIENLITKKTKAIIPVHFAGQVCEMQAIKKIAKKHKFVLIDDACHALGAYYKNKKIGNGTLADLTVFSFHPVKSITTGEGGAILTNNKKYYERMLRFRSHGIVKSKSPAWHYEMRDLGFNYRITDIQCALGISQLKKIKPFVKKRENIANYYYKKLRGIDGLTLPVISAGAKPSWHLFPVRVNKNHREKIFNNLRGAGIGVQVFYIPIYLHPYYKKLGYKKGLCLNAEEFYASSFSLPIYPDLKRKEQDFVIKTCKDIIKKF